MFDVKTIEIHISALMPGDRTWYGSTVTRGAIKQGNQWEFCVEGSIPGYEVSQYHTGDYIAIMDIVDSDCEYTPDILGLPSGDAK